MVDKHAHLKSAQRPMACPWLSRKQGGVAFSTWIHLSFELLCTSPPKIRTFLGINSISFQKGNSNCT